MRWPQFGCHSPVTRWLRGLVLLSPWRQCELQWSWQHGYKSRFDAGAVALQAPALHQRWHRAATQREGWGDQDALSQLHRHRFTAAYSIQRTARWDLWVCAERMLRGRCLQPPAQEKWPTVATWLVFTWFIFFSHSLSLVSVFSIGAKWTHNGKSHMFSYCIWIFTTITL